ncbi:Response regulator [hydrothermal vent metagenome]|uniref:Response regulator n=1 Tax=hydrothermal vent metagenome TaxID=652676 RepID=A0A3B0W465_9ZZZZ
MSYRFHILIVDDVSDNIQVAMGILQEKNYQFSFALNGEQALKLVDKNEFDLILLDIMMPGMDGYEVCQQLKKQAKTKDIPIIFLTAKVDVDSIREGFSLGAVDYISKPFHPEELIARVKTHLDLFAAKRVLKRHNLNLKNSLLHREKRFMAELEDSQKEMISVLTDLMEVNSDETGRHIRRVAEYSRLLAHYHPSLTEEDAQVIFHAAPMHDIGKIAIPHHILHKPGRLTEEEFEVMKTHTTLAHEVLKISNRKFIKAAEIIAMQHHEKWDGSGYPLGLSKENIHLYARIVAIADVFDALTHKRVYKDAWSTEDAVEYIIQHKNTQFDPELVDIFVENVDEFITISHF